MAPYRTFFVQLLDELKIFDPKAQIFGKGLIPLLVHECS